MALKNRFKNKTRYLYKIKTFGKKEQNDIREGTGKQIYGKGQHSNSNMEHKFRILPILNRLGF